MLIMLLSHPLHGAQITSLQLEFTCNVRLTRTAQLEDTLCTQGEGYNGTILDGALEQLVVIGMPIA